MERRVVVYISLALFLTLNFLYLPGVKAESQATYYPNVSISGSGTLTSNITGTQVEVRFTFAGAFWTVQEVEIPSFNVTGTGAVYNISGSINVGAESQDVKGVFTNVTFTYLGKTYLSFIINVANATTEKLAFSAVSPWLLIKSVLPGKPNYAKYTALLVATLWDSDYPYDIFITKPPRFLTSTVSFPK